MARSFNGTSDRIITAPGALTTFPYGTVVAVVRRNANLAWHGITCMMVGTGAFAYFELNDTNEVTVGFNAADVSTTGGFAPVVADGWCLVAFTKASGTATPTAYKMPLATGVFSSAACSGTLADGTQTFTSIGLGCWELNDYFNGDIAAVGVWSGTVLSASQIQTLASAWSEWAGASAFWLLDQAATTMPVSDSTGGGANQTALTGTTVSTSSVPIGYGAPILGEGQAGDGGVAWTTGTGAVTNASDIVAGTGTLGSGTVGSGTVVNAGDVVAGAGLLTITGSGAVTNANDVVAGTATTTVPDIPVPVPVPEPVPEPDLIIYPLLRLEAPGLAPLVISPESGYIGQTLDLGDAALREVVQNAPDADGTIDTSAYIGARTVTLSVIIDGAVTDVWTAANALRAFTHPRLRPTLYVQQAETAPTQRLTLRRSNWADPIGGDQNATGLASEDVRTVTVQWVAPLGILESADEHVAQVFAAAASEPGRTYSRTYDRTYPASAPQGTASIVNAGTYDAYPVLRIYGPCTDPVIDNLTQGKGITLTGLTLTADEYVEIDTRAKTIYKNSDPALSLYQYMNFTASSWWTLTPGVNVVRLHPATFTTALTAAQIRYRDAWL